jgi:hypothetical protein
MYDDFTYVQDDDDEEEEVVPDDADEADEFREAVANAMWAQYLAYGLAHGLDL